MHLFDQKILGLMILFLLGLLVVVKRMATGSVLDRPKGNFLIQLVNSFNLFFLLIVNPLAAILLITRHMEIIDPTRMTIDEPWILHGFGDRRVGDVCDGVFPHGMGVDHTGA